MFRLNIVETRQQLFHLVKTRLLFQMKEIQQVALVRTCAAAASVEQVRDRLPQFQPPSYLSGNEFVLTKPLARPPAGATEQRAALITQNARRLI